MERVQKGYVGVNGHGLRVFWHTFADNPLSVRSRIGAVFKGGWKDARKAGWHVAPATMIVDLAGLLEAPETRPERVSKRPRLKVPPGTSLPA